ncbi:MAG: hypothetical protein AVDCRST_MAG19-1542 [uncultured Thermomicrobiales bacterium]|uniref:Uncharacterized protein n=1 Tax=uncultured Thermomicrobiales bacterium TaxID=1645740 RepID=A0A6J4U844_9BACT|nr:MAG: hypothetical protein AVDCRST_MAG19-1542 [uncultured Thermomicrobiales bacterium]
MRDSGPILDAAGCKGPIREQPSARPHGGLERNRWTKDER